jgi:RNA polymerase sigma-70 factor (ECF subfamily)
MNPPQEARFLELLREHRAILYKVAYGYCRDREGRQDLVQEMTIQLWRSFPRYDGRVRFSTWAFRVAMNTAISHLRSERRRDAGKVALDETLAAELAQVEPWFEEEGDNLRVLRTLVEGMDALNRALLLLYLDGHSAAEIGEIVGISPANVTTRMNRIKHRLQGDFARLAQPEEKEWT